MKPLDIGSGKQAIRQRIRQQRAALAPTERLARDRARMVRLLGLLAEFESCQARRLGRIACYCSTGQEPGTTELIPVLAHSYEVLLPALVDDTGHDLDTPDWALWEDHQRLRVGRHGIPQPSGPRLGAEALQSADLILVPALAVSPNGSRIGHGAGWYDRALSHARNGAERWALVCDEEVVADLPQEPTDLALDRIITERRLIDCRPAATLSR